MLEEALRLVVTIIWWKLTNAWAKDHLEKKERNNSLQIELAARYKEVAEEGFRAIEQPTEQNK